ncbi:MAG: response regulator transcription factor [Saprospiraceae bacterium]|nr:response regulator transcription factor [Saprospiraceae bacterium]
MAFAATGLYRVSDKHGDKSGFRLSLFEAKVGELLYLPFTNLILMIRILIADDHQVLLDGLESLLNAEEDIEVVAKCSNGEEVIHRLADSAIDLVLMDINMPRMNGIEAMEIILKKYPDIHVIALSMYKQPSYVNRMLNLGVSGYVLKDEGKKVILEAISSCMSGKQFISRQLQEILRNERSKLPFNLALTSREKEVLKELGNGSNSKEISEKLFISFHTVRTHRKHLMQKFNVKNVTSLLSKARDMGII